MYTHQLIRKQLERAGFKNKFWGWSAIRELPFILHEDEYIEKATSGMYEGGHAVVLATNKRILFLDKKLTSFVVEDIPYDMVSEVEYHISPFNARLTIHCQSKKIEITSISQSCIRSFAVYVERQVNNIRASLANWAQLLKYRPTSGAEMPGADMAARVETQRLT